jgi:hypothetical protein
MDEALSSVWTKRSEEKMGILGMELVRSVLEATISWFKLRKCGILGSAFFFSTSCARVDPSPG